MCVGAADVSVERHVEIVGRRSGHRQADTEDGVGSELGLVRRAVEVEQDLIDLPLTVGIGSFKSFLDDGVDVADRGLHALSEVSVTPVSQLDGLELAGRRSGWHQGPTEGAGGQEHLDFDGGVTSRVENLAAQDVLNNTHALCSSYRPP